MRRLFAVSFLLLGLSGVGYCTPISAGTYTLTGVTVTDLSSPSNTYTLTGSVTVDATGLMTGANITLNDSTISSPVFNVISSAALNAGSPVADYAYVSGTKGQLALYYLPTLDASGNIDLCIQSAGNCQASYSHLYIASSFGYNNVNLNGGTFDGPGDPKTSAVPEPSGIALMGTGFLALAGVVRRRFSKF
jgi:hypothetical protein